MQRSILRALTSQALQKRYYKANDVRVRFAPSPTGHLHIGGLRTALYNYLFARAHNGTFILRIEDTDQSRVVPGAMEKLHDDLLWAGIIPDEDPVRGGPAGPYIQAKRLELYKEQVQKLLDNKTAYHCFCTENRLELLRKEAAKCGQVPKYDNRCRQYTEEEVKERLKKNEPYCIRFKLSSEPEPFDDIVYGHIVRDITQNEGDPIIVKTDGYPTYHFANVVDDHFMGISHVLRGVEWQVSTPKHIMLYKAFGWTPPKYGHLPLILNPNGSKLSKRQGDIKVETFRKNGIFPLPLINYVTLAGGGFVRESGEERLYSYQDLIKQFDISKIKPSSGKLMPDKLLELNKLQISMLLESEENNRFLTERVKKLIKETYGNMTNDTNLELDEQHILMTLKWAQDRIYKLNDLITPDLEFLWILPSVSISASAYSDAIKVLHTKLLDFSVDDFRKDSLNRYLKEFSDDNKLSYPEFMRILRSVLSGLKQGPPVTEIMEILGKDRTLVRLKRCIS